MKKVMALGLIAVAAVALTGCTDSDASTPSTPTSGDLRTVRVAALPITETALDALEGDIRTQTDPTRWEAVSVTPAVTPEPAPRGRAGHVCRGGSMIVWAELSRAVYRSPRPSRGRSDVWCSAQTWRTPLLPSSTTSSGVLLPSLIGLRPQQSNLREV